MLNKHMALLTQQILCLVTVWSLIVEPGTGVNYLANSLLQETFAATNSSESGPLLQKFTVSLNILYFKLFFAFYFKASADEEVTPDEPATTEYEPPTISSEVEAPENAMLVQEPVDLYQSEQVISKG